MCHRLLRGALEALFCRVYYFICRLRSRPRAVSRLTPVVCVCGFKGVHGVGASPGLLLSVRAVHDGGCELEGAFGCSHCQFESSERQHRRPYNVVDGGETGAKHERRGDREVAAAEA